LGRAPLAPKKPLRNVRIVARGPQQPGIDLHKGKAVTATVMSKGLALPPHGAEALHVVNKTIAAGPCCLTLNNAGQGQWKFAGRRV